jgi:mitochondrial fission protein ELM1
VPSAPLVWALTGQRAGDRAQILALTEALGWTFVEKRLFYNRLSTIPNLLLGSSCLSLDRVVSDSLAPPWPDLIIASGRLSAPIARWIRRQAGGRTRLVHIGRPWAPLEHFDLVVSTPQYQLPPRENLLQNTLSLNRIDPERLAEAAVAWAPRLAHLPRPIIGVIVGGDARPYVLDPETADRLGRAANRLAGERNASLVVTTSRRTRPEAVAALFGALTVPSYRHSWSEGAENPYLAFLALADSLIVTGDSASMLSEACATGKAVWFFALPERLDPRIQIARRFRALSKGGGGTRHGPAARLYDRLVDLGLVTSTRDMAAFHEALITGGFASRLGEPSPQSQAPVAEELARTVARVRVLQAPEEV